MPPGLLIALALCLSKELRRLPYDVPCGFPGSLAGGSPSLGPNPVYFQVNLTEYIHYRFFLLASASFKVDKTAGNQRCLIFKFNYGNTQSL